MLEHVIGADGSVYNDGWPKAVADRQREDGSGKNSHNGEPRADARQVCVRSCDLLCEHFKWEGRCRVICQSPHYTHIHHTPVSKKAHQSIIFNVRVLVRLISAVVDEGQP